ncbi:MAG: hypothetical protein ACK55Z_24505, partial [bacterium]
AARGPLPRAPCLRRFRPPPGSRRVAAGRPAAGRGSLPELRLHRAGVTPRRHRLECRVGRRRTRPGGIREDARRRRTGPEVRRRGELPRGHPSGRRGDRGLCPVGRGGPPRRDDPHPRPASGGPRRGLTATTPCA